MQDMLGVFPFVHESSMLLVSLFVMKDIANFPFSDACFGFQKDFLCILNLRKGSSALSQIDSFVKLN